MNTTEPLQRIKAKCEQLLAIAKKRTPGKWLSGNGWEWDDGIQENDAALIASCAGPAEAGWRATIAAIDGLIPLSEAPNVEASNEAHEAWEQDAACVRDIISSIIAAWPEELL